MPFVSRVGRLLLHVGVVVGAGFGVASPTVGIVAWAAATPPLVVAADGVLCDLTRTLAADQARVVCLVPPGADPHQLTLRPSDRQALADARLVLLNGYGLTPSIDRLSSRSTWVAVSELAVPASPGGDPHVWHNPTQAAEMVRVVAARLAPVLDPSDRKALQRRSQAAQSVFAQLAQWIGAQIKTVPEQSRVLVSEHRAFSSLARRYGIRELPLMASFTTGGVVRPASLTSMIAAVRASGTRQIFAEALPISKTLRRVSRSSSVPVNPIPLVADGLAKGKNTVQTITANICTFAVGQGGRCDTGGAEVLAQSWAAIR